MASTLIHLAVAKELKNKFNIKNEKDYYLGSIAPDLSKQIGDTKTKSHFFINTKEDVPNVELFMEKYKNYKTNSFNFGYLIHLYTDKYWIEDFINDIITNNSVKLLDGTIINMTNEEMAKIIYSDYTNINIEVIDMYELDLSLFYQEFNKPDTTIDEIDINKLYILLEKIGIIIENTKVEKSYFFDATTIQNFVTNTVDKIYEKLK